MAQGGLIFLWTDSVPGTPPDETPGVVVERPYGGRPPHQVALVGDREPVEYDELEDILILMVG